MCGVGTKKNGLNVTFLLSTEKQTFKLMDFKENYHNLC